MSHISHTADWVGERRADNVSLAPRISEDWLSLIIGLAIFLLALAGLANVNLIGWVAQESSYWFRRFQTGLVQNYALLMLFGLFVFVSAYLIVR